MNSMLERVGAVSLALLNSAWLTAAIVLAVWAVFKLVPRINAATRYVVWWAVLGAALLLALIPQPGAMFHAKDHQSVASAPAAVEESEAIPAPAAAPVSTSPVRESFSRVEIHPG